MSSPCDTIFIYNLFLILDGTYHLWFNFHWAKESSPNSADNRHTRKQLLLPLLHAISSHLNDGSRLVTGMPLVARNLDGLKGTDTDCISFLVDPAHSDFRRFQTYLVYREAYVGNAKVRIF